jgi:endoglycosylceramidase
VPWLEWAYCACDDPTGSGAAEALVYDPRKAPRGANVNHTTLPWLDEPYPQRTAGTPTSYGFDQKTATFHYTYSTRSAVTGRRARGKTVVFTSPLHYPHGYRATVSGAKVVAKHPRHLVLRNRASSHTVTVRLTPRK